VVVVLHLLVAEDPRDLRETSSGGEVNKDLQERMGEGTITAVVITIGEVRREKTLGGGIGRERGIHHHMINREAIAKEIAARKMFQRRRRELHVLVATRLVTRTT
jgi:hypothetical protein